MRVPSDPQVTLWHNPRCSKSREAKALLEETEIPLTIVEYLQDVPTVDALREVLAKLGMKPAELLRDKEAPYADLGLANADDDKILAAMVAHPILIERPIAITNDKAVIGRPPERVFEALLPEPPDGDPRAALRALLNR